MHRDRQDLSTAPSYSFFDVLTLSAIGGNVHAFTRLSLRNFTEGWFEPGRRRRTGNCICSVAAGLTPTPLSLVEKSIRRSALTREHLVRVTNILMRPLCSFSFNRRLQLGLSIPFVDSLQGTNGLPSATSFGDIVVIPQLMLEETESRSVSALLAVRTPTGETKTGNDKTILTPTLALWQDLPAHWQLRGGVGMDFATHNNEGPDEVLNVNLAAGNTLTSHEAAPIGDLTPYLSMNLNQFWEAATTIQTLV